MISVYDGDLFLCSRGSFSLAIAMWEVIAHSLKRRTARTTNLRLSDLGLLWEP